MQILINVLDEIKKEISPTSSLYDRGWNDALEKAKADKDIGVVLMTEKLINMCKQTVYDMKLNSTKPLIVEIPDRHGTSDISKSIDGYVRDAIGLKL